MSADVVTGDGAVGTDTRMTLGEMARLVGMSPRNIRAHQTRKLLAPPVREGRLRYYDAGHLRQLEAIKALQRQGYNLVAIKAILGRPGVDGGGEAVTGALQRLSAEHPQLIQALTQHNVVVRTDDGAVRMVRSRVLRSAAELHGAGVQAGSVLQVLVEALDRLRHITDELVQATSARVLALTPGLVAASHGAVSWDDLDRNAVALAQGVAALLTEAFRVAVERSGQMLVPELVAQQVDVDLRLRDTAEVDTG